ncbi:MAG: hypothetical protein HYW50_02380 [Candidatus Diapherotrites archaeon]|nr:hypothetical protein [Candidatus Diapherotrites archaeon]
MLEFLFARPKQVFDPAKIRIREISIKLSGFDSSFIVQQTFNIKKHGLCPAGKILRGTVAVGKKVHLSGFEGTVESIEASGKVLESAPEGSYVALKLKGLEMPVKRGDILHFK